jgi:uncharacterized protein (TIGR00369 family)
MIHRVDMDINMFLKIGFHKFLGFKLVDNKPDHVKISVDFREELSGAGNAFHGGVISSIIDTVGGFAAWSGYNGPMENMKCSTITMNVQYIAMTNGESIVAEGIVTKRGRDLNYVDINVKTVDNNRLIAKGSLVYRIAQ